MCGIVGYVGPRKSSEILLDGLRRLEYRGYDSAGLAVCNGGAIRCTRAEGKLERLASLLSESPLEGSPGIGHTRWATHGRPSEQNAHPHKAGPVAVVHNGIIENHLTLRAELEKEGRVFLSETDTEIISHLIAREVEGGADLATAVRRALTHVRGSYAIAVLSEQEPRKIVAARFFSPLVIGLGQGENFLASDVPAILSYTRDILFLEDGDVAELSEEGVRVFSLSGKPVERKSKRIDWSVAMAEKGGFKHYMLKEIFEQPRAVSDTLRGRISLERGSVEFDGLNLSAEEIRSIDRVVMVACGTSWHAALVGKFWLEEFWRIPVEVDWASEFRYRQPVLTDRTLLIAISQSGETADTLAAIQDARKAGAKIISVCNVVESSIARASHHTLYTYAGPEVSVASTKAFVTQLSVLYLFAIHGARLLDRLSPRVAAHKLLELVRLPLLMEEALQNSDAVKALAERFHKVRDVLYLGRWIHYPIALEGALKLKEISYVHAEGYPAGEMKHGPIALIDENLPVLTIVTQNRVYEKILSNLKEAQARRGQIIAIASEGDREIETHTDKVIYLPAVSEDLEPLLAVIPLQLFAYYVADFNGTDVDQPRNLAKSVTVE